MTSLERKEQDLFAALARHESLIIAYSGGVDSSYLAYAAHAVLGPRSLAVTAESPSYPSSQRRLAEEVAVSAGFAHRFVSTREMADPNYARNPTNRCYFCKSELFGVLEGLRKELAYEAVAYGVNTDDTHDFRPGHRAADEHRVLSPLLEAELSKRDVRALAGAAGLPSAETPASACLASRIPYGMPVTAEKLRQIERAEESLRELGFRQLRVRHHGELARIEISPDEMARALDPERMREMSRALHDVGFRYVSLDLDGYRSGSLNEGLAILPAPTR